MLTYVLSGGGMKGAWSAGVLDTLRKIETPSHIYGISVGALNGVLLCAGISPGNYWIKNVTKPSDLFESRSNLRLLRDLIFNKFDGFMGFEGLRKSLDSIDWAAVRQSRIMLQTGAVNIGDGKIYYANPNFQDFKTHVLASCAIPLVFPLVQISDSYYTDGGLCEVVPLKPAIEAGADEIVVVAPHPVNTRPKIFETRNPLDLVQRYADLITENIIANDIARAERINAEVLAGKRNDKRFVKIRIYRPEHELGVSVSAFTAEDIKELVVLGRTTTFVE